MVLVVAVSVAVALLVCHFRSLIAEKLKILDKPDGVRKLHEGQVPLVGGVAILAPFVAVMAALAVTSEDRSVYLALAWLAVPLWVLGCLDDRLSLRPLIRLVTSACVVLALILVDSRFAVSVLNFGTNVSVDLLWLAIPFSVIGYLALQNAVNMADGMNGVVGSTLLAWSSFVAWKAGVHSPVFLPLLALAGATVVALVYNMRGKLFFGDNGSYSLSIVVGALVVFSYNSPSVGLRAEEVVLIFLIPVLDATRLIIVRSLAGGSPFQGDRNHLHHILQRRFSWPWSILVYVGLVAAPLVALAFGVSTLPLLAVNASLYVGILLMCRPSSAISVRTSHQEV